MSELRSKVEAARRTHGELRAALKIDTRVQERSKVERDMERPGFWENQESAQKTVLALKGLKAATEPYLALTKRLDDLEVLVELAESENDAGALAESERELAVVHSQLGELMLRAMFTGPHDEQSAYVNLQCGMGGRDSTDWTMMIVRMIARYAEIKGFECELLSAAKDEEAGYKSATLSIEGRGAYGWLKGLQGTLRLVRISPYDHQQRRQTAFSAVEILPASDEEEEIEIKEGDLEWETFASGGPGGQHVNKTQSGVRVRHIPTGITVACTEQRNQGANKRRARGILAAKLASREEELRAQAAATGYQTKSNMGFGASDRILSVTLFPFTLVKDHRTGWETSDTEGFLAGKLDSMIEAYLKWAASGGKPVGDGGGD
ncbi:PCRF domain-containing protein [bacterium]|nr:PCRF domain-containing protein [bacterium]